MTLEAYLAQLVELCTHVMVVRNGQEPRIEAVTHISQDQVEFMKKVWTKQYYAAQEQAWLSQLAQANAKKRLGPLNRRGNGLAARAARKVSAM